ncbi:hypothetical protein HDE_09879 [Halotydeus destructor]|nr:hypothetical protein HDE_09879 [Halotydeus destructor]
MMKSIGEKVSVLSHNKLAIKGTKIMLVVLNLQISLLVWFSFSGMKKVRPEPKDEEERIVLIAGPIVTSVLALIGIFAAIKENYIGMIIYIFGVIGVSVLCAVYSSSQLVYFFILLIIFPVAIFYALLLKARTNNTGQSLQSVNPYLP